MGRQSKVLKGDLRRAIRETGGNVSQIAERFEMSRQAIYYQLDRYQLRDELNQYRRLMFDMAEGNVFDAVAGGDLDLSRFVLTHMPGGNRWSSRHDVTVGAVTLSPEALKMLEALGVDPETVGDEFERLIQQMHAETIQHESD